MSSVAIVIYVVSFFIRDSKK